MKFLRVNTVNGEVKNINFDQVVSFSVDVNSQKVLVFMVNEPAPATIVESEELICRMLVWPRAVVSPKDVLE